jgi:hypothetical protein
VHAHSGSCHCGAIKVELRLPVEPSELVLGACQCSFCRKHNARTCSHPDALVTLTAREPECLQLYEFGMRTVKQVICRRCGVYLAMVLVESKEVWSVINVDALDDRSLFTQTPEERDFDAEDREDRIQRRKTRWSPTTLVGWPVR